MSYVEPGRYKGGRNIGFLLELRGRDVAIPPQPRTNIPPATGERAAWK